MPIYRYEVRCFSYQNQMIASIIRKNLGSSVIKNICAFVINIEYLYHQYKVKYLYDLYKHGANIVNVICNREGISEHYTRLSCSVPPLYSTKCIVCLSIRRSMRIFSSPELQNRCR